MYLKATQKTFWFSASFCLKGCRKMQRVVILGCSGSGKSTLARALGDKTGLPVVHGDRLFWHSGWVASTKAEIDEKLTAAASEENWIIDGNYTRTLSDRVERCDTIIFLDMPRWLCLLSVFKRFITSVGTVRPDMGEGCKEKIDWEFLTWIWNFNKTKRPMLCDLIKQHPDKEIYIFKSRKAVKTFLKNL